MKLRPNVAHPHTYVAVFVMHVPNTVCTDSIHMNQILERNLMSTEDLFSQSFLAPDISI